MAIELEIELYRMLERAVTFTNASASRLEQINEFVDRHKIVKQVLEIKLAMDKIDAQIARIDKQGTQPDEQA